MARFEIQEGIVGLSELEELISLNTPLSFLGYATTVSTKTKSTTNYKVYVNEDSGVTYVDVEMKEGKDGFYIEATAKDFTRMKSSTEIDFIVPLKN